MDEATLRHGLDARTPEPTEPALDAARQALQRRIDAAEAGQAPRRRPLSSGRRLALGGLVVAAAAAAAAVVATNLGPAPAASADVSRTLQGAADRVAAGRVATSGVRQHIVRRISTASGTTREGDDVLIDSSVLAEGDVTLRRTASGAWERIYSPLTPLGSWGPGGPALLAEVRKDADAAPIVTRSDRDKTFWDQPDTVSPLEIAATPRDPDALARRLAGVTNPDSSLQTGAERAIDKASAVLGSGLADAELQAAVYRALERLPGLVFDRHARDVTGRPGVAIGVITSAGQQRIDLILDPATGRYLGRTEVDLATTASAGAPAGSIEEGSAAYPD